MTSFFSSVGVAGVLATGVVGAGAAAAGAAAGTAATRDIFFSFDKRPLIFWRRSQR